MEELVKQLIENSSSVIDCRKVDAVKEKPLKQNILRKYKIKDIVFLAIISGCMLITGAIMPLVTQVPVFGIIEIALGLQFSIFPVIGLMKVRKPGAMILISLFCGLLLAFMFLPMFACLMLCSVIVELLTLLIFRGYDKNSACVFAGTIYMPLTLPFLYLWYNVIYTIKSDDGKAVQAFVGADPTFICLITFAVVAICFVGSLIGMKISKEMEKAGVMKK